ncbi:MAG TPA: DHA2 family efflux MFS transporter permease subunit [Alphaproteobacteria bacterium]|nr:DHA2 family efflux MFS transporter permease subunit [Alphaproteobacteria bacterium]
MTDHATISRSLLEEDPVPIGIWLGFLAMCVGMFMAILDIQIVASSLPDIGAALRIPHDQLSWVQTAYLIAEVIGISLTGRLTRLVSLGRLFVAANLGFTLASLGCALSHGFSVLIVFRVIQGFCGGMVIPIVFNAVFVVFPERARVLATTVAGVFAMLAPTLGPTVGGYITETYTWHWLFLVNLAPGVLVAIVAGWHIRAGRPEWKLWKHLDYLGVALCAIFLAGLEILLKEGPTRNWHDAVVTALVAICIVSGGLAVVRCLRHREPVVALAIFGDRIFAVNAGYSFLLGAGLYGSVYLLPIFLGFVRQHSPLEIGEIMFVTGAAQLAVAPVAAFAEKRVDARLLIFIGYGLFAVGLIANGFATYETDFRGLFWPQILRGLGVMLCLLPTTTMALERRTGEALSDASALFNLMRNLGGAIGIAFVDTILEQRAPVHIAQLVNRLEAGDPGAARLVGLPLERFHNMPLGPIDQATKDVVAPLVERAALVLSFNEAWTALGVVFALSLLALPLLRPQEGGRPAVSAQPR